MLFKDVKIQETEITVIQQETQALFKRNLKNRYFFDVLKALWKKIKKKFLKSVSYFSHYLQCRKFEIIAIFRNSHKRE